MISRYVLGVLLLLACAGPLLAEDPLSGFSVASNFARQFDGGDELLVRGQEDGQTSRIDWLLPRSNLPLPLLEEKAEEMGVTLPLPLGAGVIWTEMDRNVHVTDLRLGTGVVTPQSTEHFVVGDATFHASSQIARIDLWPVPFMNVYGIVGYTSTRGTFDLYVEEFPLPSSPTIDVPVHVQLNGPTYGAGATFAIGTKDYFATVDINKTKTDFNKLASQMTCLVIAPRVGMAVNRRFFKGEFHIGAMYQDTAQTVSVLIDPPGVGELHVEVDQIEPNPWNFLVGMLWAVDERVHWMVEGGMGGRGYIITGLTVRF